MTGRPSDNSLNVAIPDFATPGARETLRDMEIKLGAGNGVRVVLSDRYGYATIAIDPDGSIDRAEWQAH